MKIFVLLIAFTFASVLKAEISEPTKFVPQAFDVINYSATLDLSDSIPTRVLGKCDIQIKLLTKNIDDKFYFHLADLIIDSLIYDNSPVSFEKIGEQYSIPFQSFFNNGFPDTIIISVYYSGAMKYAPNNQGWAGVNTGGNAIYAMGVGFSNPAVSATRYWLPCYDHPSDKATFKAKFIVPAGKTVASIGLPEVHNLDNGTDVFEYTHNFQVATYLMTFAVSNYLLIENSYKSLPIHIYTAPNDSVASAYYYHKLPEVLSFYESIFGDYPFEKVGYVNTATGSMEHQTMISMDASIIRKSIKNNDSLAMTAAHELAHQWFGNMITPYDFRDAWLNEGFASFSEALWKENIAGKSAYLDYVQNDINQYISYSSNEGIFSLYDFPRTGNSSNYPLTIYKKGSAVLAMLRYSMGDEKYFEAMKSYTSKYKYLNATSNDFQSIVEETSSQSYERFFQDWVYSKGYPVLEIIFDRELTLGADSAFVTIKQVQDPSWATFEHIPVEISFKGDDGQISHLLLDLSGKEQVFKIENIGPTKSLEFNRGPSLRALYKVKSLTYLSIGESSENSLIIYPNPAVNAIYLNYIANNSNINVSIYSILGEEVYHSELQNLGGRIALDLPNLSNGNYILRLIDGESIVSQRFLINR